MSSRVDKTKRIMRTIGCSTQRIGLYTLADGTSPLVVALPNENASEVIDRVHRIGGSANVAIAYAEYFEVLTLVDGAHSDGELVINHDLSMGMLSIKIRQNPGTTVRLRFNDADIEVPQGASELAYA